MAEFLCRVIIGTSPFSGFVGATQTMLMRIENFKRTVGFKPYADC